MTNNYIHESQRLKTTAASEVDEADLTESALALMRRDRELAQPTGWDSRAPIYTDGSGRIWARVWSWAPNIADLVDKSNVEVIEQRLTAIDPDGSGWQWVRIRHWATPLEMLLVNLSHNAVVTAAHDIVIESEDYLILDDMHFSQLETEYCKDTVRELVAEYADTDADAERIEQAVWEVLSETGYGANDIWTLANDALETLGKLEAT
jgi:hypothetical protein